MAVNEIRIKRGDRLPKLTAQLKHVNGDPVDLTGASVQFQYRRSDSADAIGRAMTVIDSAAGIVEYQWVLEDTVEEGRYEADFEATYADGSKLTVPTASHVPMHVYEDLGTPGTIPPPATAIPAGQVVFGNSSSDGVTSIPNVAIAQVSDLGNSTFFIGGIIAPDAYYDRSDVYIHKDVTVGYDYGYCLSVDTRWTPSADGAWIRGIYNQARLILNNHETGMIHGAENYTGVNGTGTISGDQQGNLAASGAHNYVAVSDHAHVQLAVGSIGKVYAQALTGPDGKIDEAYGVFGGVSNSGSSTGAITTAARLCGRKLAGSAGGPITNMHGLLVDDVMEGANNWAIKTGAGISDFGDRLIALAPDSAIADGSLGNSKFSFYLDESSNRLKVKTKYSTGVVQNGEIALSATGTSRTVTGPATSVTNHVATFADSTGLVIQDGGVLPTGNVTGPGTSVLNNLAVFADASGKILKDGGPPAGGVSSGTVISAAEPRLLFSETDQGTDAKTWDIDVNGQTFSIRPRNDADSSGLGGLSLVRNALSSLKMKFLNESGAGQGFIIQSPGSGRWQIARDDGAGGTICAEWLTNNSAWGTAQLALSVGGGSSISGADVVLYRSAAKVFALGSALNGSTDNDVSFGSPTKRIKEVVCGLDSYGTAQVDKTDTTYADLTGCQVNVDANGVYAIEGHITCTCPAAGGAKVQIAAVTATATDIRYNVVYAATGVAATISKQTALAAAGTGVTAAVDDIDIMGYITVGTAGSLKLQVAQNAASGTSNFFKGGWLRLTRIA